MSAAQQAKSRRRQMANNYDHLSPRQRPNYKRRDAKTAAAHLARIIANERRMQAGKKKK